MVHQALGLQVGLPFSRTLLLQVNLALAMQVRAAPPDIWLVTGVYFFYIGGALTTGGVGWHALALSAIDCAHILLLADVGDAACTVSDCAALVDASGFQAEYFAAYNGHLGVFDGDCTCQSNDAGNNCCELHGGCFITRLYTEFRVRLIE